MSYTRISAAELTPKTAIDSCVLDVRTAAEVRAASLPNSIHIPLDELDASNLQDQLIKRNNDASKIYLLCQSGRRAEMAADKLMDKVGAQLIVIDGGMDSLKQSSIPIKTAGKSVMSLERQVRIAAGSLVFVGTLLGFLVHPGFYGVSAFVGAGLAFAGITDTCLMGTLIAKMPWNK